VGNVHRHLKNVSRDSAVDGNTIELLVKRVRSSGLANSSLHDEPCSGRSPRMILLDMAQKGTAISSVAYVARVNSRMHRVRSENKMKNVLLLLDSVRLHTNLPTTDAITKLRHFFIPPTIQPRCGPHQISILLVC
jgi:hypothetical protein